MVLDIQLLHFLNGLAGLSRFCDAFFVSFAEYLPYFLILALLAFAYYAARPWNKRFYVLGVALSSAVISRFGIAELIRLFYNRPRPFEVFELKELLTHSAGFSFPSGHSSFFFALAMVVYLYNKKWGTWFFIATVAVTISRVIVGVHYPSDILGGAVIGILIGYLVYWFSEKIKPKLLGIKS